MKILLVAINAKYIHSNLAVYDLRAFAKPYQDFIEIAEYTINQSAESILMDIYQKQPDLIAFSTYIWNLSFVKQIGLELRKLLPQAKLWLGGPEVSYDSKDFLKNEVWADGIMCGEGERTFLSLLEYYIDQRGSLREIKGITYRVPFDAFTSPLSQKELPDSAAGSSFSLQTTTPCFESAQINTPQINTAAFTATTCPSTSNTQDASIIENPPQDYLDLSEVPFVYEHLEDFQNKIIYYEASRGCPFHCAYCLSSIDWRVRFRSIELVKKELKHFLQNNTRQVKFVDRTFNCKHEFTIEILRFLIENDNQVTNFHFEIAADLLNETELSLFQSMRPGLVQLEIGVQTTNPKTLASINRTTDTEQLKETVARLRKNENIHLHLDLIAGLPYEDLSSFEHSFCEVYAMQPHELQLGFLKVLKGSAMYLNQKEYGLVYQSQPPYEVLYTKWLSYDDLLVLKGVEQVLEIYYNSLQYRNTLSYLITEQDKSFAFYLALSRYYAANGYNVLAQSRMEKYRILYQFLQNSDVLNGLLSSSKLPDASSSMNDSHVFQNEDYSSRLAHLRWLLTLDFYSRENAKSRPDFSFDLSVYRDQIYRFYQSEHMRKLLPEYEAYDRKQIMRMTHIDADEQGRLYLFNYKKIDPVTGACAVTPLVTM